MKKLLAYSLLASVLLFTGCGSQEVDMDDTAGAKSSMNSSGSSEDSLNAMGSDSSETMSNANDAANSLANAINNTMLDTVYFAFDKYSLNGNDRQNAKMNADKITVFNGKVKIKLEGNSDEWGTDEYNYALGLKRAKAAKDALIADGINENIISLVSFGESNPVCTDKNTSCWKQNRRVEYKLLP